MFPLSKKKTWPCYRYENEQKVKRINDIKENELIKAKMEENRKKAMESVPVIEPPLILGLPGW